MSRRQFLRLLGGAAVAWPLAARAQQPDQMRRIGVLMGYAESDLEAQAWVTAFVQGFKELGWIVGRNNHLHPLGLCHPTAYRSDRNGSAQARREL